MAEVLTYDRGMRHSGPARIALSEGVEIAGIVALMIGDDPASTGPWEGVFRPTTHDGFELPTDGFSLVLDDGRVGHVHARSADRDPTNGQLMINVYGSGPGGEDVPR